MKGLTLLTALAVVAPLASAAAQSGPSISGPSISGWAAPGPSYNEPQPAPLWNNPDRSALDDDDDDLPPLPSRHPGALNYAPPPYPQAYRNDPVQLRPPPPPSHMIQPSQDDGSMPPGWRPGYPHNQLGGGQLGMGQPIPPPDRYPNNGPPPMTFENPAREAPGAMTAMRGTSRSENAMQTLLDQGYSRINPVQEDGRGFVTYAERDGVEMRLWVNPDTGEVNRLPD